MRNMEIQKPAQSLMNKTMASPGLYQTNDEIITNDSSLKGPSIDYTSAQVLFYVSGEASPPIRSSSLGPSTGITHQSKQAV